VCTPAAAGLASHARMAKKKPVTIITTLEVSLLLKKVRFRFRLLPPSIRGRGEMAHQAEKGT